MMKSGTPKRSLITIAGKPGSGKSTTGDLTAALLGFERFSSGDHMRTLAKERGHSIHAANQAAESDHSYDEEIDSTLRRLGETKERMIIDSRLAFHWIPDSFKVYLELDLTTAAKRIFDADHSGRRESGEHAESVAEMEQHIRARFESEQKRYYQRYGVDPHDPAHFDLIIDTTAKPAEEVAREIAEAFKLWKIRP